MPASAQRAVAQGTVSTGSGAALGLYSAGMFGLMGSLLPCDRTLLGPGCVGVSAVAGGALGFVSGGLVGAEDEDKVRDRARGALYGTLIGAAAGTILQRAVRQYGAEDALLVAVYGGAVGAAPRGTLIGTGVGAVVGGVAWAASPRGGLQDLILFTAVGSTVGGLCDWAAGAVDARDGGGRGFSTAFSIAVG